MSVALPTRDPADEDAWLQATLEAGEDALIAAVIEASAARRPRLAARLVVLLPEDLDDPALKPARAAAALWLAGTGDAEAQTGWEDAFAAFQQRRTRIFRPGAWRARGRRG